MEKTEILIYLLIILAVIFWLSFIGQQAGKTRMIHRSHTPTGVYDFKSLIGRIKAIRPPGV